MYDILNHSVPLVLPREAARTLVTASSRQGVKSKENGKTKELPVFTDNLLPEVYLELLRVLF